MSLCLSQKSITSFCGNVLPLHIGFDSEQHDTLAKADIKWECDSDTVTIRSFSGDRISFNNGVLLTLQKVGKATVTATLDGKSYSCEVIVTEPEVASSEDDLEYFIGDLHDHTTNIHVYSDFAERTSEFQHEYINYVKDEDLLDFSMISDHGIILNDTDFFRNFTEVEKAEPSNVIFFPGNEAEVTVRDVDRFGITHKHSGELVVFNTDGYGNTSSWEEFYEMFKNAPSPVGIFAHPQIIGFSTPGVWDFYFHKNNTPEMLRLMRGIEIGDGSERQQNLIHEYAYSSALDSGFKVSTTCSSDSHGKPSKISNGRKWGYYRLPGKTVIMAKKKSRDAFIDALRNNRFYATESGNIKLRYTVNGKVAPCILDKTTRYKFHVELSYFNEDKTTTPINCRVISDGGETLLALTDVDFSCFDFDISSETAHYFYLRFVDELGRRTWSVPVWTGREFDKCISPDITPIDMSDASAVDILTGNDASVIIDGDPNNYWESESNKACIVIDLAKTCEISALGNYFRRVLRETSPFDLTHFSTKITGGFPTRVRISTSIDGNNYTVVAETNCRAFSGEQIITFDKVFARYVKFEVLSTVGLDTVPKPYADTNITIGNISLFK